PGPPRPAPHPGGRRGLIVVGHPPGQAGPRGRSGQHSPPPPGARAGGGGGGGGGPRGPAGAPPPRRAGG
ncbi:hypothetical protein FEM20_35775, partial [Pseudomonas aeruginosa]